MLVDALAGLAGSDPALKPSGSDQMPCQKPNGTPSSVPAMVDRNAAEVWAGLPPANVPETSIDVPGAITRSCLTACGSAWPANAARAAPTAAATSVVSAAAASTTQCADIRRIDSGPRGFITGLTIPHRSTPWQIRARNKSMPASTGNRGWGVRKTCVRDRARSATLGDRRARVGWLNVRL